MTNAKVLVVGATGFIGRWVCRVFGAAGAQVLGVTRNPVAAPADFQPFIADLSAAGSGTQLIEATKPDLVVNAAGYGVDRTERDSALAYRLNAELVEELGQALAALPAREDREARRMVHLGSAFEYGSVSGTITEETPCRPATDYGRTKLEGTLRLSAVRERTGLGAVTVRVATVYGPGEHAHRLLPSLLRAAGTGETLQLTAGAQERDFTFVREVAEGVFRVALCRAIPGPILNLATGELHTVREFATRARDMLGLGEDRLILGALPYRPDEVWQGPLAVGRLVDLLGWRPTMGLEEGIRASIAEARMREEDRG